MNNGETTVVQNKNLAILAYITLIGWIIALVMNMEKKDPYVNFHIKQMLGLMCISFGLMFLNVIPIIGWIINLFGVFLLLILWIIAVINVLNGQKKPIPILGNLFVKWFANILN